MENLLTTKDIAEYTNRSVRAIQMNSRVDQYLDGYKNIGTGRPAKLYKPDVLKLWGLDPKNHSRLNPDEAYSNERRTDYGAPRGIDEKLWYNAVSVCKECYLSMPKKNLQEACRITVAKAKMNGIDLDFKYFENRMSRNKTKTNDWRSPYFAENWKLIHDTVYRVKDNALNNHPFTSYNLFSMFHNAGLLDKGRGSRRVIVVDDFKRDVWVDDNGNMDMPWGLLFIDGITNYPLMCIPAETIDTDTIAAGVLMTAFSHGINEDTVWVFETSKAMNNPNIRGLIKSLYSPEQLEAFKVKSHWVHQLFPGQHGPYVNSPAQIAQSIFKSKVERSIRNFKDEFDGVYFPTSYQGGDRKEGVQLTLSGSPLDVLNRPKPGVDNDIPHSKKLIPINDFWSRFHNWIWGKYINVPRKQMYSDFRSTFGINNLPSIKDVHEYFTSDSDGTFKPNTDNIERFAYVLYYAQSKRHPQTVKVNRIHQYQTTIDGRLLRLRCDELDESHVGLKVCTISNPFDENEFLVMEVTNPEKPVFIGLAHNRIAMTMEQARAFQIEAQQMRESDTNRMKADAEAHYRTMGDDFDYESTPPTVEQWTNELGAKQSRLIGSYDDMTDELNNDVIDVEEIDFNDSPKLRRLSEDLGEDF